MSTALEAFVRLGRQHYGTDEALAAQLNEAEIRQSRGEHDEARNLYTKVIDEAADAAVYANPWVSLADLRAAFVGAQQQFQQANQFAAALALSDACQQILPADERAEMEAQTHKAWGEFLMRDVAGRGSLSGQVTEAEARVHFRAAADAYQRLTSLRYTTHNYPDDLWKSGECFLRGQNYEAAIPLFRQFLQLAPRALHPQGLVGLGECHLALGRYHEALQVLEQCIQSYPKHPESYQARLLASHAYLQLQQLAETNRPLLQKAKQLLLDNLQNSELTPRSIQWQHSLFAYGKLLFNEGMTQEALSRINGVDSPDPALRKEGLKNLYAANTLFLEAIRHLDEAVQRYPDAAEAGAASYCIAEAYRHAAKLPGKSLLVEPTLSRRGIGPETPGIARVRRRRPPPTPDAAAGKATAEGVVGGRTGDTSQHVLRLCRHVVRPERLRASDQSVPGSLQSRSAGPGTRWKRSSSWPAVTDTSTRRPKRAERCCRPRPCWHACSET